VAGGLGTIVAENGGLGGPVLSVTLSNPARVPTRNLRSASPRALRYYGRTAAKRGRKITQPGQMGTTEYAISTARPPPRRGDRCTNKHRSHAATAVAGGTYRLKVLGALVAPVRMAF